MRSTVRKCLDRHGSRSAPHRVLSLLMNSSFLARSLCVVSGSIVRPLKRCSLTILYGCGTPSITDKQCQSGRVNPGEVLNQSAWNFYAGTALVPQIGDGVSVLTADDILSISWNAYLQRYVAAYSAAIVFRRDDAHLAEARMALVGRVQGLHRDATGARAATSTTRRHIPNTTSIADALCT
jgi:hypothetical protein